jgi:hypothetical protein
MTAEDWLRARLPAAPESLLEMMIGALEPETGMISETLARAAMSLYAEVVALDGGRDAALPLLAADALLTHAFQARAEEDPDGLEAFAERWGASGELGRMAGETLT